MSKKFDPSRRPWRKRMGGFDTLTPVQQQREDRRHQRYWAEHFAQRGDPREWPVTKAKGKQPTPAQMEKFGTFYDAWLRGDWNDVPDIIRPKGSV